MEKDLHTIYVRTTKGLVPYMGGANFLNGKNTCEMCGSEMERTPLKQPFIRVDDGKILVDTNPEGLLIVTKVDTDWVWDCKKCNFAISRPSKVET